MDAGDELKKMATLGVIAEMIEKDQVESLRAQHADTLERASIQMDAAAYCLETALDILSAHPATKELMMVFMGRMHIFQCRAWADTLRKEQKRI